MSYIFETRKGSFSFSTSISRSSNAGIQYTCKSCLAFPVSISLRSMSPITGSLNAFEHISMYLRLPFLPAVSLLLVLAEPWLQNECFQSYAFLKCLSAFHSGSYSDYLAPICTRQV